MEKRTLILTIEIESSQKAKALKLAVIEGLENDDTDVKQITVVVADATKPKGDGKHQFID